MTKVLKYPHPSLTTPAKEVVNFDKKLANIVKEMLVIMKKEQGIGLAANQVDILKRVMVVHIPSFSDSKNQKEEWRDKDLVFINPKIILKSGVTDYEEGCLSFPGVRKSVSRFKEVIVKAQDLEGKEFTMEAEGILAICLQHEMDHLDGIVFTERSERRFISLFK